MAPSAAFAEYQAQCLRQLWALPEPLPARISTPVNLRCVYYMPTRRRVDLVNLIEATCDILVKAGVLEDDHCRIVAGHDGSRVEYDKGNPRAEITITALEDDLHE